MQTKQAQWGRAVSRLFNVGNFIMVVLFTVGLGWSTQSQAGVVTNLFDDFSGSGALNASVWDIFSGGASQSGGNADVLPGTELRSDFKFGPGPDEVLVNFKFASLPGANQFFGFYPGSVPYALFRQDTPQNTDVYYGSDHQQGPTGLPAFGTTEYTLDWTPQRINFYLGFTNGTLMSTFTPAMFGSNTLFTTPLNVEYVLYGSSPGDALIDSIAVITIIPEPSTMALCGIAPLVFWAIRRRKMLHATVAAVIVAGLTMTSAQATLLLHDDFNGAANGAVNGANWTVAEGFVDLDGNGFSQFHISSSGGYGAVLNAVPANNFAPVPGTLDYDWVRLKFAVTNATQNSALNLFNGSNFISIRDDSLFPSDSNWTVFMGNSTAYSGYDLGIAHGNSSAINGTWEIDWTLGRVKVLLNGAPVFDTTVQTAPQYVNTGPLVWNYPTGAMRPQFVMYTGEGVAGKLDFVNFDTIPEPTAAVLVAMGGLGFALRRRHKARR